MMEPLFQSGFPSASGNADDRQFGKAVTVIPGKSLQCGTHVRNNEKVCVGIACIGGIGASAYYKVAHSAPIEFGHIAVTVARRSGKGKKQGAFGICK